MDYYGTLGVPKTASTEEIRSAYRELALKHHPDRNIGNEAQATAKFKDINEAFDVLNHPEKRSQYDRDGYVGRPPPGRPRPPKPAKPKPPPPPEPPQPKGLWEDDSTTYPMFEPTAAMLDAVPCSFVTSKSSGRNIVVNLPLTAEQRKNGGFHFVKIKRKIVCKKCIGDGVWNEPCPYCSGRGRMGGNMGNSFASMQMFCPKCDGASYQERICPKCNGSGVDVWEIASVKVKIPERAQVGQAVLVMGEGECAAKKPPGNLRVIIVPV